MTIMNALGMFIHEHSRLDYHNEHTGDVHTLIFEVRLP